MDERLKQIQKLLDAAEGNLHSARNLMRELVSSGNAPVINPEEKAKDLNIIEEGKIIEGVYNGDSMVGPDGKEYPVPANYASKSKLVEGDVLKLTIAEDGSFIFKQISPIERRKTIGTLSYSNGNYSVNADGKTYKVLQASVTYYKGEPGDQVSLILPKEHESTWGAIENIIKKIEDDSISQSAGDSTSQETDNDSNSGNTESLPADQSDEPEIILPTDSNNTLNDSDEEILKNLQENTVPNEQIEQREKVIEPPVHEDEEKKTDDNNDQSSQGIKELDI